jgi:large subunit ribosomal protein L15
MATLNTLTRPSSLQRSYRRVGRGQGSKRGKQSGRGGKGQTARAGNKRRPELRDIIKKLPKRRGYGKNRGRTHVPRPRPLALDLAHISAVFAPGSEVTAATLVEKNIVKKHNGRPLKVMNGEIDKKLSFRGLSFTASARAAVEKAGGTIA